ncbi:MAG TPA: hypothetical protein HPP80_11095 [Rhodospirillaceae bacterium]|nr:hypothetical protein [Rhodospirillaceae bacterium]
MIEAPDGILTLCWYSGSSEANADSRVLCSNSNDKGETWSQPRVVVDRDEQALGAAEPNKAVGNVTLFYDQAGRLWIIYGVIQRWNWPLLGTVCRNWLCGRVDAKFSLDHGKNWSPAIRMEDQTGALVRSKPLHLSSLGDIIPLYLEGAERSFVRILDLADTGQSPQFAAAHNFFLPGSGLIQPSLVQGPDGKIYGYFRDVRRVAIYSAEFDTRTLQWSAPEPTNLPNPGSAVEAFTSDDGKIVLVYNPSSTDRHALRLAASSDGLHFSEGCDLVADRAQGDVAYPTIIQTADSLWHLTYSADDKTTIHHVVFDTVWLHKCLER